MNAHPAEAVAGSIRRAMRTPRPLATRQTRVTMARSAPASVDLKHQPPRKHVLEDMDQRRAREEASNAHGERLLHDQPDDPAIGRANQLQGGDGFLLIERQRVDDEGDDHRRHDEQEPRKEADLPARALDHRTAEHHLLLCLGEG